MWIISVSQCHYSELIRYSAKNRLYYHITLDAYHARYKYGNPSVISYDWEICDIFETTCVINRKGFVGFYIERLRLPWRQKIVEKWMWSNEITPKNWCIARITSADFNIFFLCRYVQLFTWKFYRKHQPTIESASGDIKVLNFNADYCLWWNIELTCMYKQWTV